MRLAGYWQTDVELRALNTLGITAKAQRFCRSDRMDVLQRAAADCRDWGYGALVLGGGSNLLIADDLSVPVIQPDLRGIVISPLAGSTFELEAAAAEPWDAVVRAACERGLWGIENLALIPGTAGAAPVQNIGAYGVELKDSLAWVEAMDLLDGRVERLDAGRLALGYRDSRFKHEPGRWMITRIGLHLQADARPQLGYAGLAQALSGSAASPVDVADAVRAIRRSKLPDPARLGNAGSFFKNPEIDEARATDLLAQHPDLPAYAGSRSGTRKLSAAWLIERSGYKGYRVGDAGISERHALVLVNHGRASGNALLALAREVADGVQSRFGIALEPEPVILGATFRPAP